LEPTNAYVSVCWILNFEINFDHYLNYANGNEYSPFEEFSDKPSTPTAAVAMFTHTKSNLVSCRLHRTSRDEQRPVVNANPLIPCLFSMLLWAFAPFFCPHNQRADVYNEASSITVTLSWRSIIYSDQMCMRWWRVKRKDAMRNDGSNVRVLKRQLRRFMVFIDP